MSSSKEAESSTSAADKVAHANKSEEEAKKTLPQLGALEEDDEFEEFEAEDWDDSEASLTQISTSIKGKSESLNGAGAGGNAGAGTGTTSGKTGSNGMDNLWEDNWDDDDIDDDFSVQLRKAISEHNNNGPAPMAT